MEEDYSKNPEYHYCKRCNIWKHRATNYYVNRGTSGYRLCYCKACYVEINEIYRKGLVQQNGGRIRCFPQPNTYCDDNQKEMVFDLMKKLKYLYNEELGVWLKPNVKEVVDGEVKFMFLKKRNVNKLLKKRNGKKSL